MRTRSLACSLLFVLGCSPAGSGLDAAHRTDANGRDDAGSEHDAWRRLADTGPDGWHTGELVHDGTVTLHGSGFGDRPSFERAGSDLIVRAWDDCTEDDPMTIWDGVGPSEGGGSAPEHVMRCRTPEEIQRARSSGTAPDTAHPRATRYLAGAAFGPDAISGDSYLTVSGTEAHPDYYASFYYRADPDWYQTADTDGNHKMYSYSAGDGPYDEEGYWYFGFVGFADPEGGVGLAPNYFTGLLDPCTATRCVDPKLVNWYSDGCGGAGGDTCAMFPRIWGPRSPRREWIKIEYVFRHADATSGVHDIYLDNQHVWHVELDDDSRHSPPARRSQSIGGYRRDYGTSDEYRNNWSYFSDVYVDLSWARVMIADAESYESATIVEPQPLISWSDASIELRTNLGRLASGSYAWVFVIDAANDVVGGAPLGAFVVP